MTRRMPSLQRHAWCRYFARPFLGDHRMAVDLQYGANGVLERRVVSFTINAREGQDGEAAQG
jgi:hypothetical protein